MRLIRLLLKEEDTSIFAQRVLASLTLQHREGLVVLLRFPASQHVGQVNVFKNVAKLSEVEKYEEGGLRPFKSIEGIDIDQNNPEGIDENYGGGNDRNRKYVFHSQIELDPTDLGCYASGNGVTLLVNHTMIWNPMMYLNIIDRFFKDSNYYDIVQNIVNRVIEINKNNNEVNKCDLLGEFLECKDGNLHRGIIGFGPVGTFLKPSAFKDSILNNFIDRVRMWVLDNINEYFDINFISELINLINNSAPIKINLNLYYSSELEKNIFKPIEKEVVKRVAGIEIPTRFESMEKPVILDLLNSGIDPIIYIGPDHLPLFTHIRNKINETINENLSANLLLTRVIIAQYPYFYIYYTSKTYEKIRDEYVRMGLFDQYILESLRIPVLGLDVKGAGQFPYSQNVQNVYRALPKLLIKPTELGYKMLQYFYIPAPDFILTTKHKIINTILRNISNITCKLDTICSIVCKIVNNNDADDKIKNISQSILLNIVEIIRREKIRIIEEEGYERLEHIRKAANQIYNNFNKDLKMK